MALSVQPYFHEPKESEMSATPTQCNTCKQHAQLLHAVHNELELASEAQAIK